MMDFGTTTPDTNADLIKDVSEATFMADVVDASAQVPVIVDFWAPWCGPCKQLTPALEAAITKKAGKVRLAKINVDENQQIAGQMRVQSIPAVFAFVDGQPIDGFMGAQTPSEIDAFLDKAIAAKGGEEPGLEEALLAADEMLAEGAVADAAQTYAAVLQEEPENAAAHAGLAKSYLTLDDLEKARAIIANAPEAIQNDAALIAIAAEIDLKEASAAAGDTSELKAKLDANPDDHQTRFDLATALAGAGDNEAAIAELLELFKRDREWNDGAAKDQLIKICDMLGPKDPIAQTGRRKLTSMIFA